MTPTKRASILFKLILSFVLVIEVTSSLFTIDEALSQTTGNNFPAENLQKNELNFIVLGDWGRKGKHRQDKVADQMGVWTENNSGDFVITVGDNFYNSGVESVTDKHWQKSFNEIYTAESLYIPWFVTLGNHDYYGNVQAQINYSGISGRWNLPNRYYAKDFAIDDSTSVKFLFIDTNIFIEDYRENPKKHKGILDIHPHAQLAWVDSTLSVSNAKWNIIAGHHPVYSASYKHGNTEELQDHLLPLLNKYEVDLYFSGHEHDLQYLKPEGTVHYVISGGGSQIRSTGRNSITKYSKSTSGFVGALLTPDSLTLEFVSYKGELLYRETIIKKPD
jgi:predicted MPP superfamily phosphohydrolase